MRPRHLASLVVVVWALGGPAAAGDGPREVRTGLATVVVRDAALVDWARHVGALADRAIRVAADFWDVPAPAVHVVIDERDDVFNASVDPLPDPVVHLRTRAAMPGEVGFGARDPLYLLLVHEAIHAVHFGGRPGSLPTGLGVVGADAPWPPPAWLLEGVAVWAESRLVEGGGGRLDAPETRALLRRLAAGDGWPSLEDASLVTHAAWPGGEVRYLVGGAFVDRLVGRHGLDAFRAALRRYETIAPWRGFAGAWRDVTGGDLRAEWEGLRRGLAAEAAARRRALRGGGRVDAWATGDAPARSPDGTRLAWVAGGAVRIAPYGDAPDAATRVPVAAAPARLAWWGEDRLVYARIAPTPTARFRELVALDLATGEERVLTRGARAWFPAPLPNGCVAFVRDTADEGSALRHRCEGGAAAGETLWTPPEGIRIVGLAASPSGRLAAVLWREGDTWLVEVRLGRTAATVVPLDAPAGVRDPVWDGEEGLLVRAEGPAGTIESWRVGPTTGRAERLTATVGGVLGHAPGVVVLPRTGAPVLASVADVAPAPDALPRPDARPASGPTPASEAAGLGDGPGAEPDARGGGPAAVAPYAPLANLRPLGWLPDLGSGARGVTVIAADPTGTVAATARAGTTSAAEPGPLGPAYVAATLRRGRAGPVPIPGRPEPLRASLRLGVLPYRPHAATGPAVLVPRLDATIAPLLAARPSVRAALGLSALVLPGDGPRVGGVARIGAADGRADAWGVPRRGWSATAIVRIDPVAGGGVSAGAWADAAAWAAAGDATVAARLRAGWRPPPAVPTGTWGETALSLAAGGSWTVPIELRVADGRWAWERLRVEPGVRANLAWEAGVARASVGPELRLAADLVAGYGAPLTIAVVAGGQWGGDARGPWLRLEGPALP